ncbi:MAG TPA: amino acid permease, partial [Acidimicrobiales bacterium]
MAVIDSAPATPELDPDVDVLHRLGYAQELRRRMSGFSNFAVSFTIISILSGCLTAYGIAMTNGGPVDMTWGWILVGIMTLVVGMGMAEVCSSMPTAGGLYYWSAKLAKRNGAAWSWFTGWFNLLGQVAVTAGIDYGFSLFFNAFLNLTTGWAATPGHTLIIYAVTLLFHAGLNIFGVRVVAFLSDVSVWWHLLGVLLIVIVLLAVPAHHASTSFVFTKLVNETGFHNSFYVFMIGLLLAQYTFTGYDAS